MTRDTRLFWKLTREKPRWTDETPEVVPVALLRRTQNSKTELWGLLVEEPDRSLIATFIDASYEFAGDRLVIHGVPERERGSRVDHIESYHARPLTSESGVPTQWRVEIFTTEEHETLVSEEPATLSMEMWRRDKEGRLTPEDRALLDEWGYPRHDPVERLVVRWPGGNKRYLDEHQIARLLPHGFTIEAVTKHRGEEVSVTVGITASQIPEVDAVLGR